MDCSDSSDYNSDSDYQSYGNNDSKEKYEILYKPSLH